VSTAKLDLSLRLRHDSADIAPIIEHLGIKAGVHWNKGDTRRSPAGELLDGRRDFSYCSFPLIERTSEDLDEAITACLEKLAGAEHAIQGFVKSGGTASLAIGWFCLGDSGGRISCPLIAEIARISLTIDFYLYFTPTEVASPIT